jgi:hypothetical protein
MNTSAKSPELVLHNGSFLRLCEWLRRAWPRPRACLVGQRAGVRPAFVLGRAPLRLLGGLT